MHSFTWVICWPDRIEVTKQLRIFSRKIFCFCCIGGIQCDKIQHIRHRGRRRMLRKRRNSCMSKLAAASTEAWFHNDSSVWLTWPDSEMCSLTVCLLLPSWKWWKVLNTQLQTSLDITNIQESRFIWEIAGIKQEACKGSCPWSDWKQWTGYCFRSLLLVKCVYYVSELYFYLNACVILNIFKLSLFVLSYRISVFHWSLSFASSYNTEWMNPGKMTGVVVPANHTTSLQSELSTSAFFFSRERWRHVTDCYKASNFK